MCTQLFFFYFQQVLTRLAALVDCITSVGHMTVTSARFRHETQRRIVTRGGARHRTYLAVGGAAVVHC